MKKVVFMGTPDFAVPILQKLWNENIEIVLVVTQPDRKVGRKQKLMPPPVKKEAIKKEIPVFQPEKLSATYEKIINYEPDLIITAAYGQILPQQLLDYPKYGCINVHASLLPKLRGGAPIHHAILQGEKETGITIMYMVEKLDAGDILSQKKIPIEDDDDVGILHDQLADLGADLLVETIPSIFKQTIQPKKQDEKLVTYAPNITREDEEIHWKRNSRKIYNQIRGLRPWPGAFTTYENQRIKIWASELTTKSYKGKPGEIVEITPEESITVLCGDQIGLKLIEIQPAGRRRMTVAEYLRGSKDELQMGKAFD